jgi:hypothetical protein
LPNKIGGYLQLLTIVIERVAFWAITDVLDRQNECLGNGVCHLIAAPHAAGRVDYTTPCKTAAGHTTALEMPSRKSAKMRGMAEQKKLVWFAHPTRQYIYGLIAGFGAGVAITAWTMSTNGYGGYWFAKVLGLLTLAIGASLRWATRKHC